ncbi:hypothetical protein BGW80DRAFT_1257653 [Lactifluus volemus]|nr:hypothetical protein BGW80DRAFT_1257653 [Lactifluus volemus]
MPSSASRAWLACAKPPSWSSAVVASVVASGRPSCWPAPASPVCVLIDFDYSVLAHVGTEKYELWRGGADGAGLLQGADWVVDAIDNIGIKVELLAHCVQSNIKVFSFMGAGTTLDPTRMDLSATHYDPLARAVRQPNSELTTGAVDELAPLRDFDVPIFKLPMLGPIPALLDLKIATYVLCQLAGRPIDRPTLARPVALQVAHRWQTDQVDRAAPRSMGVARYDAQGSPFASQPRILRRGGDEGGSAMSRVFSRPDEGHEADLGLNPPQGYVDALGEPINPARFDNGIIISSSEEVWGIEAARVTHARRFGEWEFHWMPTVLRALQYHLRKHV